MPASQRRNAVTPRHARRRRHRAWPALLKGVAAVLSVVLVSGVSVATVTAAQFASNLDTVDLASGQGAPLPQIGEFDGGFNILLVGSDSREGREEAFGYTGSELNDVNILVHVANDHSSAVVVSIPRDLVVPVPACPDPHGEGELSPMRAQPINSTLGHGGLACTVLTVEELTGLSIPYAGLITFDGVAMMSSAVGGVDVCIDAPIYDRYTGLDLPTAGNHTLVGYQALAFLRSRHGVGDGSDLGRISSQQVYMSSLVRTLKSSDTLTNPGKLYNIAKTATESMTLSTSLANLDTMVSMANVLRKLDLEKVVFVQYPGTTGLGGVYEGKVAPIKSQADALMAKLQNDELFALEGKTGVGSTLAPGSEPTEPTETAAPAPEGEGAETATPTPTESASPTPEPEVLEGVLGQTAAQQTCSRAN
ncbi:LCP family protein [Ruicaihuangia caeni]|uniref:LCP family protein n=1 Tax=Ruicaihuangia caeni TaxID=3042517 RepID=A0AAW6T636_9MICO|nr:LCP family protein [Klugiella sp. YN-L-19]MDI2098954.1 LCP family protein [Klugiella sp. YN-L-19]